MKKPHFGVDAGAGMLFRFPMEKFFCPGASSTKTWAQPAMSEASVNPAHRLRILCRFPVRPGDVFGFLLFAERPVNRADLLCRLTGDMSLAAVVGEEAHVDLRGDTLAEAIARGKSDWHTLQKNSVSIRRYKIKEWNLKEIAAGVYRRTWGCDDFPGYMHGAIT